MKKIYLLVLFVFGFTAFAQQKGISYQAVIINPNAVSAPGYNGTSIPLANKSICLSFQIVNTANQVEYQESQSITTDGYGMINVVIGTGTSGTGLVANLDAVNWNQGNKKLVVGVNTDGVCSNYTEISNQVLNYTPYSLYAQNADLKDGYVTDPKVAMGINPAKVGLGNVNNTSDANKPVSTATQTALNLKANTSSLSTVATSGNYNDLTNKPIIPSSFALPTATASVLGGVKVGANLSIDANGVLNAASGNNASTLTGVVSIANGGTSTTSVSGIKSMLGLNTSNIAIGDQAGQTGQQNYTIALGAGAGASNQISGAIAIGGAAGGANQGSASVAIGSNAGQANQSQRTVAIGFAAGQNNQGENAVAIGTFAGNNGQIANSIAINATGMSTPLNPTNAGFYVNPIRNAASSNSLFYDPTTKEITYGSGSTGQTYVDLSTPQTIGGAKIFSSDLKINGLTFGKGAGSNNGVNTAIGASALASNTTGAYNTAIGFQVLTNNTTGNNNHALGFQVLAANTTGSRNTALGEASLPRNTSGSDNVAIGLSALFRNTTADNNIAIGTQALGNSLTGSNNVAIGSQTLTGNSTSSNNTAVGYQSLKETSGSDNTALGRLSLMGNTIGSFNTAVGSLADVNSNNLSNTTAIGYGARALANNTIQLGADGSSFVTNGMNMYTTAISNVRTSGTLTLKDVTYPNTNGTAGQVLTANNNGNATWTTIASGADASTLTGTLPIAKGGTGETTLAGVKNTLGLTSSKLSIGSDAGLTNQGNNAIALGYNAGKTDQGASSIAIGYLAGGTATQGISSIAIGPISGGGGNESVAIGLAAWTGANNATAVGTLTAAGHINSSALGYQAVTTSPNTIQLGADGVTVAGSTAITNVRTSGSLTAGAVTYPNINGTAGQVLTANNNGNASWTTVAGTLPTTVNTSANYNIVMATGSNAALVTGTGNGGNAATLNPYTGQMSVSGLTAQGYGITSPIYASTPQTLTDATTIAWNPLNGLNANVTLGGNRTLNFSGSLIAGSYGTLVVTQDVTGGRTLTLPSVNNKVLGSSSTTTIALSTAAGAKDIVNFYYDGTNYFWNVGQGYGTAATSSTTNLATGVTGTLAVANGGTGATTLTGLIKGNGSGAMTAAVAGTDYLTPNGSASSLTNFPTLNQNTTGNAANVTGIVAVANGGTGTTNGSITGTTALSFAAGGSNQNVSILPSGTGSVGIGTNSPNSSAILDASSTTKGFLPPRMTYAQKMAIASPPQGLMIYCTNCGTNGEPEYYNGVAWVNMAGGTAASVPITLGSTYGGGIVFYIFQPGDPGYVAGETHGLIAATSDTQGYRVFGCRGWPAGTSTALGTGAANTSTLLGCWETNFAAKLARAIIDGGYSDWYLPSKDELNKLYLNKNIVGNFVDVNYWSSSESDSNYAIYQNFGTGAQSNSDKNGQKGIRAIRSF